MTRAPVFLTPELVIEIHARMLHEFGGDPGLRDEGLLEAAVAVPRATFEGAYLHESLADMAAAYHYHLSQNHPFVDRNKRVAVTAALVFLALNARDLEAPDEALEEIATGLAEGKTDKADVIRFYRRFITS